MLRSQSRNPCFFISDEAGLPFLFCLFKVGGRKSKIIENDEAFIAIIARISQFL